MSCFICSPAHIAVLVESYTDCFTAPAVYGLEMNKSAVARTLVKANFMSVLARYGEVDQNLNLVVEEVVESIKDGVVAKLSPAVTLKQWHCYAYQCEDFDGWEDSSAKMIHDMACAAIVEAFPNLHETAEYEAAGVLIKFSTPDLKSFPA